MMKGYTKIELTDVATGKKKVVEHKNMVTNAMSALARSFQFLPPPLRSGFFGTDEPFVKTAFGGIFLFESPLSDDPDDFLMPDDNKVVGYGCGLANNSINTMMGSYNTTESGEQEDGSYKHVWDYSTDQGNGEISAVGLAPRSTGQIGWGTPLELFESSLSLSLGLYTDRFYTYSEIFNLCIMDGYLYAIQNNCLTYNSSYSDKHISRGGKLLIKQYEVIDETFGMYSVPGNAYRTHDTIEIELPSDFLNSISNTASSYYSWAQYDSGYIYVICSTNYYVSSGGNFKIAKIKLEDGTVETITVTNATGTSIWCCNRNSSSKHGTGWGNLVIVNGKMIVRAYSGYKTYVINLTDTSKIQTVKNLGTDVENVSISALIGWFGNNVLCATYEGNKYYAMNINVKECTAARLNTSASSLLGIAGSQSSDFTDIIPIVGDKVCSLATIGGTCYFGFNPFLLTTKNNLETPVTKTSAQTMKITYILTEEA